MGQKPQLMIRDEAGERDLLHFLETLEKRVSTLEAQVRDLVEDHYDEVQV